MAQTLTDTEFGAIRVKRVHAARHVRLKITSDGTLVATLPKRAPLRLVQDLVERSRQELRTIVASTEQHRQKTYEQNERIGASHKLHFTSGNVQVAKALLHGQEIIVTIPEGADTSNPAVQEAAKYGVVKALKKEANSYLPRRLAYLAQTYGFSYESVRYTNAKGRWGSCSSTGTISLNIALMNLPMEIIDYILIHELCHTKEMNHSQDFWSMVEGIVPQYKEHKRSLKKYTPYL